MAKLELANLLPDPSTPHAIRVLVVDDVPANVKLLEARLRADGIDVLTASNGHEAVSLSLREPIDVILLDVMMPGMNGYETCRRIKVDPRSSRVPVVLVTALDESADRLAGIAAGADGFLTKPVDDVALLISVRSLASSRARVEAWEGGAGQTAGQQPRHNPQA